MASSADRSTRIDHAALFDAAPTPYLVVDRALVVVEVNRALRELVGRSRDELLGRPLFEAFPGRPSGEDARALRASVERAFATGRPDTMALQRYDTQDPGSGQWQERYWLAANVPLTGADGTVEHVLHRTEEVTDYVRAQAGERLSFARGERFRRRIVEVETDLLAHSRELQALNRHLREAGEREREVALALQRAMLPEPQLSFDGLEVAARYQPAEDALHVGGDWFDVVALADDAVALSVGDVVGKGLGAAAVMGQLRSALSAATHGAAGPPEALDTLDRYARTVDGALGSTVVQVRLDRSRRTACLSRAGHLPPLLVTEDGIATLLEQGAGPPLVVAPDDARHPGAEVALPPRATLVLYTDGLVERRGSSIDDGIEALTRLVRREIALGVEPLADAILAGLRGDGVAPDDTALVVARSTR